MSKSRLIVVLIACTLQGGYGLFDGIYKLTTGKYFGRQLMARREEIVTFRLSRIWDGFLCPKPVVTRGHSCISHSPLCYTFYPPTIRASSTRWHSFANAMQTLLFH